jgi:septum formation protein
LVLASQSPRRAQLLEQLGVSFTAVGPRNAQEAAAAEALELPRPGELPEPYARRVTLAKLHHARARCRQDPALAGAAILCADTTVALGRRILGKPADRHEARAMLQALAGRSHRVVTAMALHDGHRTRVAQCVSRVWVQALQGQELEGYLDTGEWQGKAGGYAIQGRFAAFVTRLEGSHSGVMGLPLHETWQLLGRRLRSRAGASGPPASVASC